MIATKTSLVAISVMTVIVISAISMNAAFANPYIGGYPTHSPSAHNQYTMKVSYSGVAGSRTSNLIDVFSSAAYTANTDTDPNGWIYQNGMDLQQSSNTVYGAQQVYDLSTCEYNCVNLDTVNLGSIGSGGSNINYVYSTFYWSGAPHRYVNFYYEPHLNNGTIISENIVQYDTNTKSDPSKYFAEGTKIKTIGGVSYIVKLYQFGIESSSVLSTAWNSEEYNLTYNGATSYNGVTENSTIYNTNARQCSCITYDSLGNPPLAVGSATSTKVNADYHDKTGSTLPSGTINWFESSTSLNPLVKLWP